VQKKLNYIVFDYYISRFNSINFRDNKVTTWPIIDITFYTNNTYYLD